MAFYSTSNLCLRMDEWARILDDAARQVQERVVQSAPLEKSEEESSPAFGTLNRVEMAEEPVDSSTRCLPLETFEAEESPSLDSPSSDRAETTENPAVDSNHSLPLESSPSEVDELPAAVPDHHLVFLVNIDNNKSMSDIVEKPVDRSDSSSCTTMETEGTASQLDVLASNKSKAANTGDSSRDSSSDFLSWRTQGTDASQLDEFESCGNVSQTQRSTTNTPSQRLQVRFTDQYDVRKIAAIPEEDVKLWWTSEEIAAFKVSSLEWIKSNVEKTRGVRHATEKFLQAHTDDRCSRRFLMYLSASGGVDAACVRGLEHHFVPQLAQSTREYTAAVLQAQADKGASTKRLSKVAKKLSKPARELALRRAQHDRKVALKASLTSWERVGQ
uniref:Uncharacterized protein n=1 Tax=Amphora coffeiformis TaxID=265554 RepID=A0A7S3LEK1_9STRA|eukprot:scaffold6164_cov163-Amphora_coffeaeformis.AAC.9